MKSGSLYNFTSIEHKWQREWKKSKVFQPDILSTKRPFYNLMMFPYPSAEGLHVGNMYAFTGADIYGRFQKMNGFDVFEPIGLDGFGIHSENYALKIGEHPAKVAKRTQRNFYRQLKATGNAFAWENTLETYDPNYYKWTQWIFIQMYKNGLAYRKKAPVNWCPSCRTTLSDEQVIDGRCERCKKPVEKKELEQWFFKITNYADRLLGGLTHIDWSEKVKIAQRNWIDKKVGINIKYEILNSKYQIECFTTRPDTNFGATFVVISPEHPLVTELFKGKHREINQYVEQTKKKTEAERITEGRDKTGVFTGLYCLNQLNNTKMPLYISNFVLMEFGTGAVVGVPGHDKRDFEFAQEFSLPVARVVLGKNGDTSPITRIEQVQEEEGTMINSGFLNGLDIHQATEKMMDYMEEKGWGKRVVVYHLRDWCVSRQRYWGPPIPMVHCGKCGWLPVREKDLPVLLPDIEDWRPKGEGPSPLARHKDWLKVACPECGGVAQRETDVSDTFLDSAWYFLRYPSTRSARSGQVPFDRGITKKWLPVDMYIGGAEHSVLHLMYARFLTMVFKDLGLVDFDEPFKRFRAHALLISEGAKMSKSRGNIVSPDDYIRLYGCDTLRCYLMFLGRFDQGGDFRDTGITGIWRFLNRVWKLVNQTNILDGKIKTENGRSRTIIKLLNRTIKEVTIDIENLHYNTALAKIMEYLNHLSLVVNYLPLLLRRQALEGLVLLLAPFAPHITEEIWCNVLKNKFSIHCHPWPKFDKKFIKEEETVVIAEVNGKVRAKLNLTTGMALKQEEVQRIALENSRLTKYLLGKKILRTIFVPGKIINFLLK